MYVVIRERFYMAGIGIRILLAEFPSAIGEQSPRMGLH